ncbi:MAG TPA: hypothetical protein DEQ61_16945 [Streptomyces sp.]|nr:hypothetical protein [Streptomyces sp.]
MEELDLRGLLAVQPGRRQQPGDVLQRPDVLFERGEDLPQLLAVSGHELAEGAFGRAEARAVAAQEVAFGEPPHDIVGQPAGELPGGTGTGDCTRRAGGRAGAARRLRRAQPVEHRDVGAPRFGTDALATRDGDGLRALCGLAPLHSWHVGPAGRRPTVSGRHGMTI